MAKNYILGENEHWIKRRGPTNFCFDDFYQGRQYTIFITNKHVPWLLKYATLFQNRYKTIVERFSNEMCWLFTVLTKRKTQLHSDQNGYELLQLCILRMG